MKAAAFNAECPYEIGDRVNVVQAAGRNENGQLFSVGAAAITDIACTYYLKRGKFVSHMSLTGPGSMRRLSARKKPD